MVFTIAEIFERLREPALNVPSSTIREAYRLVMFGQPLVDYDIIRAEERYSKKFRFALIVHRVRGEDRIQSQEEDIQEVQWSCLKNLLSFSGFWELASKGGRIGMDGYSACLEGHREEKYHRVCRWCPRHEADNEWFESPCCYLSDLARWLVPEGD